MEQQSFLPVLDYEALQKKANESAMKGAMQAFEEFYSGYNSPYRKAIEADLKNKEISTTFELPDIIATINDSLSKEIDSIANEAISKTFVPLVKQFLTRESKELDFSYILRSFIVFQYPRNRDDFSCEVTKHREYDWLDVTLTHEDVEYNFTLHLISKSDPKKFQILSLPRNKDNYNRVMKLKVEDVTLEMPFTTDIIKDRFNSFIANILISKSEINMDCDDFEDDWFDHCHC